MRGILGRGEKEINEGLLGWRGFGKGREGDW